MALKRYSSDTLTGKSKNLHRRVAFVFVSRISWGLYQPQGENGPEMLVIASFLELAEVYFNPKERMGKNVGHRSHVFDDGFIAFIYKYVCPPPET